MLRQRQTDERDAREGGDGGAAGQAQLCAAAAPAPQTRHGQEPGAHAKGNLRDMLLGMVGRMTMLIVVQGVCSIYMLAQRQCRWYKMFACGTRWTTWEEEEKRFTQAVDMQMLLMLIQLLVYAVFGSRTAIRFGENTWSVTLGVYIAPAFIRVIYKMYYDFQHLYR